MRIIVRLSRWYFSPSVSASISFSFSESMPWASGEETGQSRAVTSIAPNPAPVDKQKIASVKINSRATVIAENVDRIGCAFHLLTEGLTNKILTNRLPLKLHVLLVPLRVQIFEKVVIDSALSTFLVFCILL